MDLNIVRQKVESFCQAVYKAMYQRHAGIIPGFSLAQLYEGAGIYSPESVAALKELLLTADAEERRLKLPLFRHVVEGYLRFQILNLDEALANNYDALGLPSTWLEHDALFDSPLGPVLPEGTPVDEINELYEARWQRFGELLQSIGFSNPLAFWEFSTERDPAQLVASAEQFLSQTQEEYENFLNGLRLHSVDRFQLEKQLRGNAFDCFFPAAELVPAFEDTLYRLGVDVTRQPNMVVDTTQRQQGLSTARAFPVRVPEEIYMAMAPTPGIDAYEQMLRTTGQIMPKVFINPKAPWVERRLGDAAVGEAFAELFAGLLANGFWLVDFVKLDDQVPCFLQLMHHRRLFRMRRAAARVIHAVDHSLGEDNYINTFQCALLVEHNAASHILDLGLSRRAFEQWRGMLAGVELEQMLIKRFGPTWYREAACGQLLINAWRQGIPRLEDLPARLGQ